MIDKKFSVNKILLNKSEVFYFFKILNPTYSIKINAFNFIQCFEIII